MLFPRAGLLKVGFGRNWKPISLGIQIKSACMWSHVVIVMPGDLEVAEARGGHGVIKTPIKDFEARYTSFAYRYIFCLDVEEAYRRIEASMGETYDNHAFFGFLFWAKWDNVKGKQCAELTGYAQQVHSPSFLSRLLPKDIWKVAHEFEYFSQYGLTGSLPKPAASGLVF